MSLDYELVFQEILAERPTSDKEVKFPATTAIRVIASSRNWVVGDAVAQLQRVAELPGVLLAAGMPDLHPGKGAPIGVAVLSESAIYPHLAGSDIGCGMGLWQTTLPARKGSFDRLVKKLNLEGLWEGDSAAWLARDGVTCTSLDAALGTIGGGNHFAELQTWKAIRDEGLFSELGLERDRATLLVHSGSRGLGEAILRRHLDEFGAVGLDVSSEGARRYLASHDHAVLWASSNRALIAERFLSSLGAGGVRVIDLCHNSITARNHAGRTCWLHRKGAAPSDERVSVIPGSRGSLSYLVETTGDRAAAAYSIAHGAGRKWTRSDARGRLESRVSLEKLRRTELGSLVICEDRDLLYEEAPQAYKNIDVVVQDLVDAGLVRVVATLCPAITYKVRSQSWRP